MKKEGQMDVAEEGWVPKRDKRKEKEQVCDDG